MGLAAVCAVGAGAGLYFRPDLSGQARASAAPEPRPELTRVSGSDAAPEEAVRLQSQLSQLLVLTTPSPIDAEAPTAFADSNGLPIQATAAGARPTLQQAERRASGAVPPGARRTPPVTPAPNLASARQTAPAPKPLVLASRSPTPVVPLRPAPRSAPQPAPEPAPAVQPVAERRAPEPRGPSYDCSYARTTAEQMICGSPELAALDRSMAAELEAAVTAGHSARELARDQADWRRRRERAAPDPRALADAYRQRIGQLRSMQ